jgi:hypothetical protein
MSTVPAPLVLAVLVLVAPVSPAAAQWSLSAGVRSPRYAGGAVEPASGRSLGPYRPTMWEVGVDRASGRMSLGLRFRYAPSSLALEGEEAVAVVKDAMSVYGVDAEVSFRVAALGPGAIVRLFAGPVLDIWKLPDIGTHLRPGASVSVGLEASLGGRWSAVARAGGAVTGSPFDAEDLDQGLEPRALWRREVSGVLRYRL